MLSIILGHTEVGTTIWEFSPTLDVAGRPIPILMTITVQFTLS